VMTNLASGSGASRGADDNAPLGGRRQGGDLPVRSHVPQVPDAVNNGLLEGSHPTNLPSVAGAGFPRP